MKEILLSITDKIFDKMPFSKREEQLKKEISDKLILQYETDLNENNEISKATKLIAECKDIESLCKITGHAENNLSEYMSTDSVKSIADAKKILRKVQRYTYLQCFFIAIIFVYLTMIIFQFSPFILLTNGSTVVIAAALFLLFTKRKRNYLLQCDYENLRFDQSVRQTFRDINDRYSKKLLNVSMLAMAIAAYGIFSILMSVKSAKYSFENVSQQIIYFSFNLELIVYLFFKNYFCKKLTDVFFIQERIIQYKKQWHRLTLISAAYFGITLTILLILINKSYTIFNWMLLVITVYLLSCVAYNITLRKDYMFHNITVNIRKIVCISLIVISILTYNLMSMNLYLTQPYINRVANIAAEKDSIVYNEVNGIYTISTAKENFKILQLTDIHLGGSAMSVIKDLKALEACDTLINRTKPDLVVVTGDLVFPLGIMSFSLNNNAPIMQFANFMRNKGIPWAFTYGNHDTEALATLDIKEFDSLMKSLSFKSSDNLLYPYIQPDIYGRNNQMIEIRNTDGTLKQALFLLDSNDYIEGADSVNEYDYIHDDQVEWYKKQVLSLSKKEGYTIPSAIFFHSPLREYKTANDLYEAGSDQVTYLYGILGEKMIDKICCSKYESKLFNTAVELGSTKAMFCGHDHYNNQCVEYKGIRLTYGYSIDYLAMPGIDDDTEQRGATLITITPDNQLTIAPIPLN